MSSKKMPIDNYTIDDLEIFLRKNSRKCTQEFCVVSDCNLRINLLSAICLRRKLPFVRLMSTRSTGTWEGSRIQWEGGRGPSLPAGSVYLGR